MASKGLRMCGGYKTPQKILQTLSEASRGLSGDSNYG